MSRTTGGRDFISNAMFSSTQVNPATTMALADVSYAVPAEGSNNDTTLGGNTTSEATLDGFARAIAVYTHTAGAQTSSLQHTYTNSAAPGANPHVIYAVGIFSPSVAGVPGSANTGILVFETAEPFPPTLTGGDSVSQTLSIDYGV